jgi:hypothetical protein
VGFGFVTTTPVTLSTWVKSTDVSEEHPSDFKVEKQMDPVICKQHGPGLFLLFLLICLLERHNVGKYIPWTRPWNFHQTVRRIPRAATVNIWHRATCKRYAE